MKDEKKWLAIRELNHSIIKRPVQVRIGFPAPARRDWRCPYQIVGLGSRRVRYAYGVDSMQALQMALEAVAIELRPHRSQLSWLNTLGLTGLYRPVPIGFGPKFAEQLEERIQKATETVARRLESRATRAPVARE
ncbi:MAG TPA: hypothetical protein VEB21_01305 [Terriglobales bacterium]|nr:hypothetical protein [Terriglobales bacterium]